MERLNENYNLDSFSSSGLNSESDEGEDYRYEHKYVTLILNKKNYIVCSKHIKLVVDVFIL